MTWNLFPILPFSWSPFFGAHIIQPSTGKRESQLYYGVVSTKLRTPGRHSELLSGNIFFRFVLKLVFKAILPRWNRYCTEPTVKDWHWPCSGFFLETIFIFLLKTLALLPCEQISTSPQYISRMVMQGNLFYFYSVTFQTTRQVWYRTGIQWLPAVVH